MPRRLLLRSTGRTYATRHPRHGLRRTTCYRSNSVPSQDNRTAHHQGIHPGIGAPGPESPILFVPRTASRAILRVLLTDSTCPVSAASSTGRRNTPQCIDSTMLPQADHLFGRSQLKPSQGSVPAGLALASDFSFSFQCKVGSSLVLRRPIETAALIRTCTLRRYNAALCGFAHVQVERNAPYHMPPTNTKTHLG